MKKLFTLLFVSLTFVACSTSTDKDGPTKTKYEYEGLHLYDGATEFIAGGETKKYEYKFDTSKNTITSQETHYSLQDPTWIFKDPADYYYIAKTVYYPNYLGLGFNFSIYYPLITSKTPITIIHYPKTNFYNIRQTDNIDYFIDYYSHSPEPTPEKGYTRTK